MQEPMKKRRLVDWSLVVAAILLLVWLALFLKPAASADTVAIVTVSGGSAAGCSGGCTTSDSLCGSCMARTADLLYARKGVAWVKLDGTGKCLAVAYDSLALDTGSISRTIARSGFENAIARTVNLTEYGASAEYRGGKLLRQGPCGGACGVRQSKGEER